MLNWGDMAKTSVIFDIPTNSRLNPDPAWASAGSSNVKVPREDGTLFAMANGLNC